MNLRPAFPLLRSTVPWLAAVIGLQVCLRSVWPRQVHAALLDRHATRDLAAVSPDPAVLRSQLDSLARDSAVLAERWQLVRSRTLRSADPGAELASRLVPLLVEEGWKLDKVKADARDGWAVIELGAQAGFAESVAGLRRIRNLPWAVQVRRLSLRPGGSGRVLLDIQAASPAQARP